MFALLVIAVVALIVALYLDYRKTYKRRDIF
jgi:ABC-type iron transport system FetAB permease component